MTLHRKVSGIGPSACALEFIHFCSSRGPLNQGLICELEVEFFQ